MSTAVAGSGHWLLVAESSVWSSIPANVSRVIPPAIPADQAYYWSSMWQSDIKKSREALASGDFAEFDSGTDLAHWLLSEDD